MWHLLADLCESAAFLADLCATALNATAETVRPAPAAGQPAAPVADVGTGRRVRAVTVVGDKPRAGGYWFR
jgi:hypothetical protein